MILTVRAFREGEGIRPCSRSIDDLELGFAVLLLLFLRGNTLVEAHLIDENGRIDLPPDAFGGQFWRRSIKWLAKQWEKILNKLIGGDGCVTSNSGDDARSPALWLHGDNGAGLATGFSRYGKQGGAQKRPVRPDP